MTEEKDQEEKKIEPVEGRPIGGVVEGEPDPYQEESGIQDE